MIAAPLRWSGTALVLVAAIADVSTRRIPNWLVLPAIPAALIVHAIWADGVLSAVLGLLGAFAIRFAIFALGGCGAGDVKLFTAVGGLVGIQGVLPVFVIAAISGGVLALLQAAASGTLAALFARTGRTVRSLVAGGLKAPVGEPAVKARADAIPGAAPIAAGTIAYLWLSR